MNLFIKKLLKIFLNIKIKRRTNYLLKLAEYSKGISFLDIGAAGNIEPRWLELAMQLEYIGVEPDYRSYKKLSNKYNCKKYEIINKVLWSREENIDFYLCNKPEVSSVFYPNKEFLNKFSDSQRFDIKEKQLFKTSTLDIELGNRKIDFAKFDIQGAEYDALNGMQNHISDCLGFELEIEFSPIYNKQPLFGIIGQYLNNNGFEFIDFTSLIRWERKQFNSYGQCIFGDGLWLRSPEYVYENLPEKYLKYITICSIYERFDLAIRMVELRNPENKENIIYIIEKLRNYQINTRRINNIFKYIVKFINSKDTTTSYLIY